MRTGTVVLEEKYMEELKKFYSPLFKDSCGLDAFIKRAIECDWDDRKPRRMIFQVQRFVTLATDIDQIRPARDGLRMLFLKCCMESLAKLSEIKSSSFYQAFETFFSDDGKSYILKNFSLSFYEWEENGFRRKNYGDLTLGDFLCIVKAMRDMVVHDGDYWSLQMFAQDDDSIWLTDVTTREQVLSKSTCSNETKRNVTYHFETTLQYDSFIHYFVEACINYINAYIDKKVLEMQTCAD